MGKAKSVQSAGLKSKLTGKVTFGAKEPKASKSKASGSITFGTRKKF